MNAQRRRPPVAGSFDIDRFAMSPESENPKRPLIGPFCFRCAPPPQFTGEEPHFAVEAL